MSIHFFDEDSGFEVKKPDFISQWIQDISSEFGYQIEELNYIFCSDSYLHTMNKKYLQHDYLTDIITFDNSEPNQNTIEGDIFISIDRVKDNANILEVPFEDELDRVLAHGLLHLIGFGDKTEEEQKVMTEKEDACLSLRGK